MNRIGQYVVLSDEARLGQDVTIGNHVTIYPGVCIGDGCRIFDGAVLGRAPMTAGNTTRPLAPPRPLTIGPESIIGANSVLYAGSTIGARVLIGDLASLREGCVLGDQVVVGRGVLEEPALRREYLKRVWRLVKVRRDPGVLWIYVTKCALHYHGHTMARRMVEGRAPVVNTY